MIPADASIGTRARDLIDAFSDDPTHAALLLDFDGTLTPIERDPESPALSVEEIDLLHRLSRSLGTLAIVSGRPGDFLVERLGYDTHRGSRLIAFGRGGLDEIDTDGMITTDRTFERWDAKMRALAARGREVAESAWIEEKGVVLTFHWRRAPATEPVLRALAQAASAESGLVTREGKQSIEIFPPGVSGKPDVVRALSKHARVIAFFGDDVGDLETYDVLDELEASMVTFRVCVTGDEVPNGMAERADLVLDGYRETIALLEVLAERLGS